jgi:hypothetical protein
MLCQLAVAEFGRGNNDAAHRLIHEAGPLLPKWIPVASAVAGNVRGVGSALFGSGSRILPVDVFVDGRKRGWEGSGS